MRWAILTAAAASGAVALAAVHRRRFHPCACGCPELVHLGQHRPCIRCDCTAYTRRRS